MSFNFDVIDSLLDELLDAALELRDVVAVTLALAHPPHQLLDRIHLTYARIRTICEAIRQSARLLGRDSLLWRVDAIEDELRVILARAETYYGANGTRPEL